MHPSAAALPAPAPSSPPDEAAFSALLESCSGLVFSTALRRLGGDRESAREVTQNVFLAAFRKRDTLLKMSSAAAWLHRAALLEASNFSRSEARRRKHLAAWAARQAASSDGEASGGVSETLRARLDEAVDRLSDADRELVLGRYFEGRSFEDLARRRNSTPDAVRMKLSRVLEKLSATLRRRGVTLSAAGLTSVFGAQWSRAAPAGLNAASHSVSAVSASPASLFSIPAVMSSGKALTAVAAVLLLLLVSLRFQSARVEGLKTELAKLQAAAGRLRFSGQELKPSPGGNGAKTGAGPARKTAETSGPVRAAALLEDMRNPGGWSSGPDGDFETTRLDDRLEEMSAPELLALLEEIGAAPGGAGVKSRARRLLIERFLAAKAPAAALERAVRHRLPDGAFLNIALRRAADDPGGGVRELLELAAGPGALPAGRFGSDPAAALREGVATGLALRDFSKAVNLCRDAAGGPEAGDYLKGLTKPLIKRDETETVLLLLEGVPEEAERMEILRRAAAEAGSYKSPETVRALFDHPRFPAEKTSQVLLGAALRISEREGAGDPVKALELIETVTGAGERREETALAFLRGASAPRTSIRQDAEGQLHNERVLAGAVRLAAKHDPALAEKWLPGIADAALRGDLARELNLSLNP